MSWIARSWICLNRACGEWFDSYEHNPECPKCGCVRVNWRPNGGYPSTKAGPIDRTVRDLAERHGMTNVNTPSPSRLNRAKERHWFPVQHSAGSMTFAPGFTAEVDALGNASCSTSATAVRGRQPIERPIAQQSPNVPGPEANRTWAGRWMPP